MLIILLNYKRMMEKIKQYYDYCFNKKKLPSLLIGLVLVLGLALSGLSLLTSGAISRFNNGSSVGQNGKVIFSLVTKAGKGVTMKKNEKLLFKSNFDFTENKIKELLVFKPRIDFTVKKVSKVSSIFNIVMAAENPGLNNEYEITPAADLNEGNIYNVTIATSTDIALDHQYSWAFQVEAPFQVISSFPGDKASDVPLNSGIEITFNRSKLKNFENNFLIEPEAKGRFQQDYNTLVFVPEGELKEKTVYKITIKKGLGLEDGNEFTGEDYLFTFETKAKTDERKSNYINWTDNYFQIKPGEKSFLSVYQNGTTTPEIVIYKFSNTDDFRNEYFRYMNMPNRWSYWNNEEYAPEKAVRNSSYKATILKSDWRSLIEAPASLENGYYIFEMNYEKIKSYAFVQKSPIAFYYSLMNANSLVWAYDYEKKIPAADYIVKFYDKTGATELGKTGSDGLLEFDTPEAMRYKKDKTAETPVFFQVEKENSLPFVVISNDNNLKQNDKYWNYLSTDRPIYQLKDKVNFWGVAKGRGQDLKQKKLTVGIYQSYWDASDHDPLATKDVLVSPFDTFSGSLDFSGIDPGIYSLIAKYNEDIVSQVTIQIFSYAKPAYKIEVETEKENYWAGDKVNFKVKASFFDGTPVSGIKLNYDLNWKDSIAGTTTLDEKGEANIEYKPEYFFDDSGDYWTDYPHTLRIDLSPASTEEGEISGAKEVYVFGPDIYLQTFSEKTKGNNYRFESKVNMIDLKTEDYIGAPKSGQALSAKIVKYYYVRKETGEIYDPINKVKVKQYAYEEKNEDAGMMNGMTDADGKWAFEKELPPVEFGWYKIFISGVDGKNRNVKSAVYAGFEYYPGGSFSLNLKNLDTAKYPNGYKNGDKYRFEAYTQGEGNLIDKKILFYRYTDRLKKAVVKSDFNLEDVFNDEYVPSVRYTAVVPGQYGFIEGGSELVYLDINEKKLNVEIKPEKEKYRPKENIKIDFNVKDKDKNNVEAALNVASVDEALFNILPFSDQGGILNNLYTSFSSWPVTKSTLFLSNKTMGAEKGGCFIGGTMVKTDRGERPIENIRVGDVVVTKISENDHNEKKAIVQGISNHLVNGYISINGILNLTPEHMIYLNGKWQPASKAKLGDNLLGEDDEIIKIKSITSGPEKNIKVYNILVGRYHTYFASGIYVHNAEKGGRGDVRNNFIDVPYYHELRTDKNGNATAEFIAPDNITSWRVTANAYEPDKILAGSNYKLIPVGLPLFVDTVLNKFYLAGDAPILKLRAFGDGLKSNAPIEFSVKCPELGLDKKITSSSTEAEIEAGKLKEGNYKIMISAKQGDLKDTVERELKVINNYFRRGVTAATPVADGQAQIKGNEGGFTNIAFVDASSGKYFYDIINLSYGDTMRSDRYVASFYSNRLLEKYFGNKPEEAGLDLSTFYKNGLTLFPYGDDDLELTAKVSDLAGDYISTNLVKGYLSASMKDKKADTKRIATALYGLASLKEPVLDQIEYIRSTSTIDNETKVYLGLALVKSGANESAREIYNEIVPSFKDYKGGYILEVSDNENHNLTVTAMAGVLASYLDEENGLEKIWNTISTVDNSKIALELEKAMIINNELTKSNPEKTSFFYQTPTKSGDVDLSEGKNFFLYLSENDFKALSFSNVTGKPMAISYYEEGADPGSLIKNNDLKIERQYFVDNKETNELKEGSLVLVRLTQDIGDKLPDGAYEIIDYLPAGLKPMTDIYNPYVSSLNEDCNPTWHPVKIVENAVYYNTGKWFQKNDRCQVITMNYYARVVNKGEFRVQPAIIQSIDNDSILNISEERQIKIK